MARVLIVEDDPLVNRMYQKIFESGGYQVEVADNGEEGLEKIKTFRPSIVLLDMMMPKINGHELLRKLKSMPEASKTPVVVLSNLSTTADTEAALSEGAVRYIMKSDYNPKEVYEVVKGILAGYTRDEIPEVKDPKANKNK
jgi:DNA-binding response OmpR family regulator